MAILKYPGATWEPGPANKQGYAAYPSPHNKEGFVLHSMVGGYTAAYGRLTGPDLASWHFSILKDGSVKQHYDPRAVAYHCGVVGDADTLTVAVGNVALIGIEHEGGPIENVSEPLTQAQTDATIAVQRWCYDVLPTLKAPALRASHWEHNWLSATACPSGRFTPIWDTILNALKEDEMLSDDDKAWLAGLMRGVVQAETEKKLFNSSLRIGDNTYTQAKYTLQHIMDRLAEIEAKVDGITGGGPAGSFNVTLTGKAEPE